MISLGEFLLCPNNDFHLANIMKSPLLNLSEESYKNYASKELKIIINHYGTIY